MAASVVTPPARTALRWKQPRFCRNSVVASTSWGHHRGKPQSLTSIHERPSSAKTGVGVLIGGCGIENVTVLPSATSDRCSDTSVNQSIQACRLGHQCKEPARLNAMAAPYCPVAGEPLRAKARAATYPCVWAIASTSRAAASALAHSTTP